MLEPKLRFPEFSGQPVQNLYLGDATTESTERNGSSHAAAQIMGVSKVEGIVPMQERIVAADTARYKFVRTNWFAYNPMRLNIGSIARWQGDDDILVSPDYVVFRCKSGGSHRLDPAYLDHFRRSDVWEDFVSEKGDGSVRVRIYYKDLARLQLALPTFPEQQKIANCLESADTLIDGQARKVEALKAHKKGLMQQLFPQEGEPQPRLRFPEFQDSGDWKIKLGGELFANRKEKGEAGLPIYSVTMNDGMVPRSSFDRNFYDIEDPSGNRKTHRGDIAYNMMRMWQGALGTASEDCMVSPAYVVLKPRSGTCPEFFAYFFKLPQSLKLLTITSRGLTKDRLRLYFDDFANMPMCVPDKLEQQRIAACLNSLDDLIAVATRKLDTLKTHKRGLMQQLFPRVAEVNT